jgi:hypothetical protein
MCRWPVVASGVIKVKRGREFQQLNDDGSNQRRDVSKCTGDLIEARVPLTTPFLATKKLLTSAPPNTGRKYRDGLSISGQHTDGQPGGAEVGGAQPHASQRERRILRHRHSACPAQYAGVGGRTVVRPYGVFGRDVSCTPTP